jgi:hypothetical protein
MRKEFEVKTFMIYEYCDECGTELKQMDTVMTCYPPKYPHECPTCEKLYILDASYPKIEHRHAEDK